MGSGVQYIRFTLLFVLIFGVAYIIARVFVAVWKLLLIVSLAAFAYYAYGLWSAKSDIVSPSRENTLRAKTKSSNGTPRPEEVTSNRAQSNAWVF